MNYLYVLCALFILTCDCGHSTQVSLPKIYKRQAVDKHIISIVNSITSAFSNYAGKIQSSSDNNCGIDWTASNDTCFFTNTAVWDRAKAYSLSYDAAKDLCEQHYSTLLSWTSQKQWESAVKMLRATMDYAIIVDLTRNGDTGAWKWANGALLDETQPPYWNKAPQSALSRPTPDLALTTQGTFVMSGSNILSGFTCTAPKNGKNCPVNFMSLATNATTCYYLSDLKNVSQLVRWYAHDRLCKKLGGKPGIIRTENDALSFARAIPKDLNTEKVWKFSQWVYKMNNQMKWNGGTPPTSLNWATEPDNLGGVENCAVLYPKSGKISDVPCQSKFKFTCQKPNTIPRLKPLTGKYACGNQDWVRGGDSCYFTSETKYVDWNSGHLSCEALGSTLVKIDSEIERMWLYESLQKSYSYSWTGLCYDNTTKQWKWEDGTIANATSIPWQKEPSTAKHKHGACAAATAYGMVQTFDCFKQFYYVCEQRAEDATECPKDWLYFNTSCYYLNNRNMTTWRDARYKCQLDAGSTKGYLYVPYGTEEWKFVVDNLLAKQKPKSNSIQSSMFWIGVTDDNTGVWGFEWANTGFFQPHDMSHISWRKSPYFHEHMTEFGIPGVCAALTPEGTYRDYPSSWNLNIICETRLVGLDPIVEPFTGASYTTSNLHVIIALTVGYVIIG